MVEKRGYFIFGPFLAILGPSDPSGEFLGLLLEDKVLNKSVPRSYGVRSEATRRVYFGCTVPLVLKYTLRMASDLTCIQYLALEWGAQEFTVWGHFGPKWPKMAQK